MVKHNDIILSVLCHFLCHHPSIIVKNCQSSLLFALPLLEQMPAAPLVTTAAEE
jgi:hypothetical protein